MRASYTFSFPIHLSEEVVPAAIFYGTVVPVVGWLLVKSLIIDPYVAREKASEREKQRQANQTRLVMSVLLNFLQAFDRYCGSGLLRSAERPSKL